MKKVFKAEMWDKMQYLFRNYYDRMMHCVLQFDGKIDENIFKRALKFQIDNVDVLHSRYHNNFIKPYWVVKDYSIDDVLTVRDSKDLEADIDNYIMQRIPIQSNVQIRVALFNHDGKTTCCFVINHMCFDGGDLKYFVQTLCKNYTRLCNGDENLQIKTGSRSHLMIYSGLSEEDKKIAKGLYKNISALPDKHRFPLAPKTKEDINRLVKHKIPADKFETLRKIGKDRGYTVNDIMLALYIKSLYEVGNFDKNERITIPSMVDLRRHLAQGGMETGLTNHTGFMPCTVDGCGDNIMETVAKVAQGMEKNKQEKFLGLYSLPLLSLAYTVFPHCISEIAIRIGYDNPLMGMSNIGIINPEEYDMNGAHPVDGFFTGAVKGKPYMQLALTTMNNEVTMTIAVCGNEKDVELIEKFFAYFDKNADELIEIASK